METNSFRYKGYTTTCHYSQEDDVFFGEIENIKDLVSFHSEKRSDFFQHFCDAVDDYIEFCKNNNLEPNKPNTEKEENKNEKH